MAKPFKGNSPTVGFDQVLELAQRLAIGQDLPALRLAAQARGEIGDGADGAVVEPAFEADGADGGVALVRCRSRAPDRARACASPCSCSLTRSRIAMAMRSARSAGSGNDDRVIEEDHHAVSGEALERALVLQDQLAHLRVIFA